MVPLVEVMLTTVSDLSGLVTQNRMDVDVVDDRLRVCFLPEQHNSTLHGYEAQRSSPSEY